MLKNLRASIFIALMTFSSVQSALVKGSVSAENPTDATAIKEYMIQDIGTLQTCSSEAIALNNNGQILGWYNIDGAKDGKRYFVRDRDGCFHEINEVFSVIYQCVPQQYHSLRIDWRYLTDSGRAYGTFTIPNTNPVLFMWDRQSGIVKLGNLPGKKISAINNAGQVLIEYVEETDQNGKPVKRPVIWENGKITKLCGLEGNIGIESEESYGFDMNNNGEVVGQSLVSLNFKNTIYKQVHAVKWSNGQAIDLHKELQKSIHSSATAINDMSEVFLEGSLLIRDDGKIVRFPYGISKVKTTDTNYLIDLDKHGFSGLFDKNGKTVLDNSSIVNKVMYDADSIWMNVIGIVSANDNGEVIAQAKTIYGEEHAMLIVPKNN